MDPWMGKTCIGEVFPFSFSWKQEWVGICCCTTKNMQNSDVNKSIANMCL